MSSEITYSIRSRTHADHPSTEKELAKVFGDRELARQTVQAALRIGPSAKIWLYEYIDPIGAIGQGPTLSIERFTETGSEIIYSDTDY